MADLTRRAFFVLAGSAALVASLPAGVRESDLKPELIEFWSGPMPSAREDGDTGTLLASSEITNGTAEAWCEKTGIVGYIRIKGQHEGKLVTYCTAHPSEIFNASRGFDATYAHPGLFYVVRDIKLFEVAA